MSLIPPNKSQIDFLLQYYSTIKWSCSYIQDNESWYHSFQIIFTTGLTSTSFPYRSDGSSQSKYGTNIPDVFNRLVKMYYE